MYNPSSFSRSSAASGVPSGLVLGESSRPSAVPRDDRFRLRRTFSSPTGASDDAREATLSFRRESLRLLRLLSLLGFPASETVVGTSTSWVVWIWTGTVKLRLALD